MNDTLMMVDRALQDRAIVFGSLPPAGRDLDLLVSSRDYVGLPASLSREGWVHRGSQSVRFSDFTAYAVDRAQLDVWAPSATAAVMLMEAAVPVENHVRLLAPAPHHRLLILVHRYAEGMELEGTKMSLLRSFSPEEWHRARRELLHWGVSKALSELHAQAGADTDGVEIERITPLAHRSRVISLSGVDGSGKSTQAQHLQVALDSLGFATAVEWTKITQDPLARAVGASVKRAIAKIVPDPRPQDHAQPAPLNVSGEVRYYPDGEPAPADAGKRLRRRSRLLTSGWAVVVALGNGLNHMRTVRRQSARVLICDRYVFDSLVHLHFRYGTAGSLRLQRAIVTSLSPRPACTFFLDVPPAVARARKPEQYLTAELAQFSDLYNQISADVGAVVIDGTRPAEEIAAEIARRTWEQLSTSRRQRVLARLSRRRPW